MIDISLEKNRILYEDWRACLDWLKNYDDSTCQFPAEETNFHLYTDVKNEKELLSIKSFFATQDLNHCTLILWSDCDIQNNTNLGPYKEFITFEIFDPVKEAIGTALEGNMKQLSASDSLHYMKSGLLRFLMPHKIGGIWYDMDMVLLRSLKAMLDQEFAYMWGTEMDFIGFGPCAAFMNIQKKSTHSNICIDELIKTPTPSAFSRDHELLAKVYKRRPFTVFPCAFFNTEWQMGRKNPGLDPIYQKGWFSKNDYSEELFLEAFAWHWHNSSNKNKPVEPGSKFDLLNKITDERLKQKGFL